MTAQASAPDGHVAALRAFNRFYTRRIGVLDEKLYGTPFTLPQTRVLWELAHHDGITASELARLLDLDPGYLSRLLAALKSRRLVRAQRSPADARQSVLTLTAAGRRAYAPMDAHSQAQVGALLAALDEPNQRRLLQATGTIESLLGASRGDRAPYLLRAPRPGDIGWVVSCHGRLYAREYGWDESFEALVAEIAARFVKHYQPKRERCWIAERDGENVGSVFVVEKSRTVAQLRLLIVDPSARGAGIGRRLVAECIDFTRRAGYRKLMLWTNAGLDAARHLYEDAGFRLTREEQHRSFGKDLIGQTFILDLAGG